MAYLFEKHDHIICKLKYIYMNKSTYILEKWHLHPVDRLCHRYGSPLGVASCDFVSTTPAKAVVASKVSLACWCRGK
jgi:hypothetical protein